TQVGLERLRLAAVEESQSRVAFIAVPAGMLLVAFPIDGGPSPIWGGVEIRTGEIITFGSAQRLHARTVGPSHWGAVQAPEPQLADYGRVLSGTRFVVPPAARWQPPRAAARQLRDLHRAPIPMPAPRVGGWTDIEAGRGLEHHWLHALMGCLPEGAAEETATGRHHRDILARFEDLLAAEPSLPMTDICAALGVSERMLRDCCKKHLGV